MSVSNYLNFCGKDLRRPAGPLVGVAAAGPLAGALAGVLAGVELVGLAGLAPAALAAAGLAGPGVDAGTRTVKCQLSFLRGTLHLECIRH